MPYKGKEKVVREEEVGAWNKWEYKGGFPNPADIPDQSTTDVKYESSE